jgi:hypothetical protein
LTTDKIGNTLNPVAEASYDFHAMLKQLRSGALADELCAMRSRMEKKLGDACIGGYEMREVAERISPKKPPQAIPAAPIDPLRKYKPHEVAAILNCSYRTALRRMTRMKGKMGFGGTRETIPTTQTDAPHQRQIVAGLSAEQAEIRPPEWRYTRP